MRKIGKQGKGNGLLIMGVFLAIILVGGFVYMGYSDQQAVTQSITSPTSCSVATTLDLKVVDAINKGTAVSPSINAKVNGGATQVITSSTSLSPGDELEVMLNASDYLDVKLDKFTLVCGVNSKSAEMFATDDSTLQVFNDAGNVVDNDVAGGTINQSSSSTPINQNVKITAPVDKSSGDLVCVVEATNTTQVDSLTLSGDGVAKTDVPEFYTVAGAGSISKAFSVSKIIDGNAKTLNLNIVPESGETIDGTGIYFTCYSAQAFADTDGTYKVGVENADGTDKSEDTFDYDWMIT